MCVWECGQQPAESAVAMETMTQRGGPFSFCYRYSFFGSWDELFNRFAHSCVHLHVAMCCKSRTLYFYTRFIHVQYPKPKALVSYYIRIHSVLTSVPAENKLGGRCSRLVVTALFTMCGLVPSERHQRSVSHAVSAVAA